jgi:hypothetical protein
MLPILQGPVLVGFDELFDRAYGDPETPRPYAKITPTRLGKTLLPFACPSCDGIVDTSTIDKHTDKRRGFSWCPHCRKRYVLNDKGVVGVICAPARVEIGGKCFVVGSKKIEKLKAVVGDTTAYNLLGAVQVNKHG